VILAWCIKELNRLRQQAQSPNAKNYLEADYLARLIRQSQRAADIGNFSTQCTEKLGYFMSKQADAQDKVDETNEHWQNLFREFEETADAKLQELTGKQNEELETFDNARPKHPNELPAPYHKHSVEYVALRKRERLLVRNQDYVTADAVRQRADVLEDEEDMSQFMKLQDDLERERNGIIEKHSQQFNAFAGWLNARRHEMIRAREKDLKGTLRRLDHYSRIVERFEKKGIPPNPTYGFTTNRVSRCESLRAVRRAAQTPLERERPAKPRERPPMGFRPTSAMKSSGGTLVKPTRKSR
jgi:hypothetical protein